MGVFFSVVDNSSNKRDSGNLCLVLTAIQNPYEGSSLQVESIQRLGEWDKLTRQWWPRESICWSNFSAKATWVLQNTFFSFFLAFPICSQHYNWNYIGWPNRSQKMTSYSSLGYSFLSYSSREPLPDWVEEYLSVLHIVVNCGLVFQPEGSWVLEQALQGRGHSIKLDRVQEVFGQHSQGHGDILGRVLCRGSSCTRWSWWVLPNSAYFVVLACLPWTWWPMQFK